MARARNIKPGIMENEELAELEPFARLLFIYLWMLSDCEGRLEDRPKRIKAQALPYDDVDCDELLAALESKQFITRYEADGNRYIQISNFVKHQNVSRKEKESGSNIPEPDWDHTGNIPVPLNTEYPILNTEVLNTERIAPNDSKKPNRSVPAIDFNFESGRFKGVSDEHRRRWHDAYPAVDIGLNIKQAAAWLIANPNKRKKNYLRFLTSWFSRQQEKGGDIPSNKNPPAGKVKHSGFTPDYYIGGEA